MKIYRFEKSEHTEYFEDSIIFDLYCDILCVGIGTAGTYAAVSAARAGMDVIAVERDENIGGMPVTGRVGGYYYGFSGGTFESVDKLSADDSTIFKAHPHFFDSRQIHITELIHRYDIRLFTSCFVTGLFFEDNTAVGAEVCLGGKKLCIKTKYIIDSTSDGHLVRMCGVKTVFGRSTDNKAMPFTVRTEYFRADGWHSSVNSDSGYCNQYKPLEFSKKILDAHANGMEYVNDDVRFLGPAPISGVREGIRFEGEDYLSYKDIILDNQPEKVLFYAYSDIDKHGFDLAVDEELYQNWWVISNLATVAIKIGVPFGCIVPKNLKGIVTAGRCISADNYSMASVRMNRDMYRMGECVGIACANAISEKTDVLNIDYEKYVGDVSAVRCFDGNSTKKFGFDYPGGNKPYVPVDFNMSDEQIIDMLSTEKPGCAIWACFISDGHIADKLIKILNSDSDTLLRYNAAIALAIMGNEACLDTLCEIVKNRDCFYFKDCRRSNQFRSAVAVCLLGRLGKKEQLRLLEEIVFNKDEINKPLYNTLKADYLYHPGENFNFVYFQHFTHAVMAIVKIYQRLDMNTDVLKNRLRELFADETIIRNVTPLALDTAEYAEIADFMEYVLSIIA